MATPHYATPRENIRQSGWFLTAVGALFMVLGLVPAALHQLDLAKETSRATGTVVDQVLYSSVRGHLSPRPVVEFRTAGGATERFQFGETPPGVADQKDQQVTVAYDPADPSHATIDDIRISLDPLVLLDSFGLLVLILGAWVLTRSTSMEKAANQQAA